MVGLNVKIHLNGRSLPARLRDRRSDRLTSERSFKTTGLGCCKTR